MVAIRLTVSLRVLATVLKELLRLCAGIEGAEVLTDGVLTVCCEPGGSSVAERIVFIFALSGTTSKARLASFFACLLH